MAHKLYTDALHKVQQQRRMLLMQLHASLRESTSPDGRRWASIMNFAGSMHRFHGGCFLLCAQPMDCVSTQGILQYGYVAPLSLWLPCGLLGFA
jgi:hypothetical protein